jgi:uncharacterized protein YecT (DUF1311 family)
VHVPVRKPYKPLYRQPAHIRDGASVQQGLSAAFGFVAYDWQCCAADKRYSLDLMGKPFVVSLVAALALTFGGLASPAELQPEVTDWGGIPMAKGCDQNTITINQCAFDVWKKADDVLNSLYQEQLRYLRTAETEYPPSRGASRRLVTAQRAWLEFRDKDCAYQIGEPGGSGDEFTRLKCMYKHTRTRTSELSEYVSCRANGCPY